MKSRIRKALTALAVAVGISTAAAAATPVAVWYGDFTTAAKSGYTLSLKGGGALPTSAGNLALANDVLKIDKADGRTAYVKGAIVVKYSGYAANATLTDTALASVWPYNKSPDAGCEANGGYLKTYWGTTANRTLNASIDPYVRDNVAVPRNGYLILAFNTNTGTAAFVADADKTEWKGGYDSGIRWSSGASTVYGYAIGGPRNGSPAATMGPCATLTVEAVAVFEDFDGLTQAGIEELMAYEFTHYKSVLSLNFGAAAYNVPAATTPKAMVADGNWYNFNAGTGMGTAGSATVVYTSSGNYQNGGKTPNYLKGYLDDYPNGTPVSISVTNLTGVAYDVYVYCSSDDASGWSCKTVNGEGYTALSTGEATLGTDTWGSNATNESALGSNVMVIRSVAPGPDGSIILSSARNVGYRGCIAAIQLGEVETVIQKTFALALTESADWSSADWDPAIPEGGMSPAATATVTASGAPTLTLDGEINVGKLAVVSAAGSMLTIKKNADAATTFGVFDVSGAADGVTFDATEGFAACAALLKTARAVDNRFYFTGDGANGATLDYGTAENNYTFAGHYVFDGGTHTFQNVSESANLLFGANATVENPTFWVRNGATLNFKSHNPCGWNAAASDAGIVRIGGGSKVVAQNSADGTWYWSQQFYLEDGATLEIGTAGNNFRTVGNDAAKPHFVVPANAAASVSGGESNTFSLPSNGGGAAVFEVGENSTLTISAKLKTLANGKPFVKYGNGTLKVTGDVSAFNGAIQIKAGTLEAASATALGANATVAVDAGATLRITADDDRAFAHAVSGEGAVVKAGAGALAVAPGQFGQNVVSIAGGTLQFALTHEQATAGVALCQADTDISAAVTVVNASGQLLAGDFTFEDGTLSFRANCVDFVREITADVNWSDMEEHGWISSPESTITLTNGGESVTIAFDVDEVVAKSFKIVNAEGAVLVKLNADELSKLKVASYDFTEATKSSDPEVAYSGVVIDGKGLKAGQEAALVSGATIAGVENVMAQNVPAGLGFYKDATQIWFCKTVADVTRTSPVMGVTQAFTNFFVGAVSDKWEDRANWRTALDGLLVPYQYAYYPQQPGGDEAAWYPACFDGDVIGAYSESTEITCGEVEGWKTSLDFRNGVTVTIGCMKKFADWFMWIDSASSVAISEVGGSASQFGYVFDVAGQLVIGEINQGQPIAFTYNLGPEATVTYADGIKYGQHALNGGRLIVAGDGITQAAGTVSVTVTNSVAIETPAIAVPLAICAEASLTLDAADDEFVLGNLTNDGTLNVTAGNVIFKPGVTAGNVTASGGGKVFYGFTVGINDCGTFTPPTGYTVGNVRVFDAGGNLLPSKVVGDHLAYAWDVTGKNCWWDYGFDGNLTSVGTDTGTMAAEGTTPYYNEAGTALRVGYGTPYRGANYPDEFTAVIYAKMVNNAGHIEIGFGSTTTGTKYGIVFACGDPAQNEVKLLVTSGYAVLNTVSMKVPNAYDADHLYAFACQTVNDGTEKTRVTVYLDGEFLQSYTFDGKVTLGSGFQIGSIHGGGLGGGYQKATTANACADLEFLRVYQTALTDEAMTKYAELYPYVSENGISARTFAEDSDWAASEGTPWNVMPFEAAAYATNVALAGSVVKIVAAETSEVTMNLDTATQYEALEIGAGAPVAFRAGTAAVAPTVTGLATVGEDVTVDYDAINFGTVKVATGKTLTFDFTGFPFDAYYADTTIPFTGATSGEGAITATGLPTTGIRTAAFEQNGATGQYELKIRIAEGTPFVCTVAEGGACAWTFGGESVTVETVDANPSVAIRKEGTGTLEKALVNGRSYVVNDGTFMAAGAQNITASITVNANGTFDFNGKVDSYATITLNGGRLVNNGAAMGTGNAQMSVLRQTASSTLGGTGDFGYVLRGYAAGTLELGGATLTKTGANAFYLCDTTVANGAFVVEAGTLRTVGTDSDISVFAADATLTLGAGATLDVTAPLQVNAITAADATIRNAKSITAFTLNGTATFAGNGTWATNTLAGGAVANVGSLRGLVFAGAGRVEVPLTAAEYAAGAAEVFTPTEASPVTIGKVTYNGRDITASCTISGGAITAIAKPAPVASVTKGGETTEYADLRDALAACTAAAHRLDLLGNVDLTGVAWSPVDFKGTFDGHGYAISNLTVDATADKAGLIRDAGQWSTVKNLTLVDPTVNAAGRTYVGVLAGEFFGTVSNVCVTGDIRVTGKKYVGALIGHGYPTIVNCHVDGGDKATSFVSAAEEGGYQAGGIIGMLCEDCVGILDCSVRNLKVEANDKSAGGIAGRVHKGSNVVGCTVENVDVYSGTVEEMGGLVVGESYVATNSFRFYLNNAATASTLSAFGGAAVAGQLYGQTCTNGTNVVVYGTGAVGYRAASRSTWRFTAGNFKLQGMTAETFAGYVAQGYTATLQPDGTYTIELAIVPIKPGEDMPTFTGADAKEKAEAAAAMAVVLRPNAAVEKVITAEAYNDLFAVKAVDLGGGTWTIKPEFTPEVKDAEQQKADAALTSLAATAATEPSATVQTQAGLYYGIAGAETVGAVGGTEGTGWVLGDGYPQTVTTEKVGTTQGFYQMRISAAPANLD